MLVPALVPRAQSFLGLGDLPGGPFDSYARGVSGDGRTIAWNGTHPSGEDEAWRTVLLPFTASGPMPAATHPFRLDAFSLPAGVYAGRAAGGGAGGRQRHVAV